MSSVGRVVGRRWGSPMGSPPWSPPGGGHAPGGRPRRSSGGSLVLAFSIYLYIYFGASRATCIEFECRMTSKVGEGAPGRAPPPHTHPTRSPHTTHQPAENQDQETNQIKSQPLFPHPPFFQKQPLCQSGASGAAHHHGATIPIDDIAVLMMGDFGASILQHNVAVVALLGAIFC